MYVGDGSFRVRKVRAPDGWTVSLSGGGSNAFANGAGSAAAFSNVFGLAWDSTSGNVYASDPTNGCLRSISPGGVASTLAGNATTGFLDNPVGTLALLNSPRGVSVDALGRVFFTESGSASLRVVTPCAFASPTPTPTATLSPGATPSATPTGTPTPTASLASGASQGCVVSTFAGSSTGASGWADGSASAALFSGPCGLSFNGSMSSPTLIIVEINSNRVRALNTVTGAVTTIAGSTTGAPGSINAVGTAASFSNPSGAAVDMSGNIFIPDRLNHRVRVVNASGGVATWAGTGAAGCLDAVGTNAQMNQPSGVAINGTTNVYIAVPVCQRIYRAAYIANPVLNGAGAVVSYGLGGLASLFAPCGYAHADAPLHHLFIPFPAGGHCREPVECVGLG